ncbi:hypothetical protein [Parafrankia sp. FMc2]|uniref:hypothetical protein n=1 Tax=Parafrankia sp. FMc2 TaxID=3233196 RepID=UPI0034D53C68
MLGPRAAGRMRCWSVNQLRADGYDVPRGGCGPASRRSSAITSTCWVAAPFQLPDLPGGLRPLRDKDAGDEE